MADYSYQMDFNAVLASDPNHPLIVVIVDGRGTAWKGRKFRVNVSKQLGKLETEDQIEAAKYVWVNRIFNLHNIYILWYIYLYI